jgi:hypothetical protein
MKTTASEYLYHAEFGSDRLRGAELCLVEGDLIVDSFKKIASLPPVEVSGNVLVANCAGLHKCEIRTSGRLEIRECPQLADLRGSVGEALIEKCGLRILGADFECDGNLKISECANLTKVNCRVGGFMRLSGEGIVCAGPAFSCDSALLLEGGVAFFSWSKDHSHSGAAGGGEEFELRKGSLGMPVDAQGGRGSRSRSKGRVES